MPIRRALILVALLLAAVPAAASATWRGRNGLIAFDNDDPTYCTGGCVEEGGPFSSLLAVSPSSGRFESLTGAGAGAVEDSRPRWSPDAGVDPDFSPDGTSIVFLDWPRHAIATIGANGSNLRIVHVLVHAQDISPHPVYSPDGRLIAFAMGGDVAAPQVPERLGVMDADGTHLRNVPTRDNFVRDPDWQPRPGPAAARGMMPI